MSKDSDFLCHSSIAALVVPSRFGRSAKFKFYTSSSVCNSFKLTCESLTVLGVVTANDYTRLNIGFGLNKNLQVLQSLCASSKTFSCEELITAYINHIDESYEEGLLCRGDLKHSLRCFINLSQTASISFADPCNDELIEYEALFGLIKNHFRNIADAKRRFRRQRMQSAATAQAATNPS